MISTGSSRDLPTSYIEKNAPGSPQELLTATCTKSRSDMDMSQEPFYASILDPRFVRACAVEMLMDMSQEPFFAGFSGEMIKAGTTVLRELAQWKCTWTCHKSPLYARSTSKNAGKQMEHPDHAPALSPPVTTPQCGTVLGEKLHGTANENQTLKRQNSLFNYKTPHPCVHESNLTAVSIAAMRCHAPRMECSDGPAQHHPEGCRPHGNLASKSSLRLDEERILTSSLQKNAAKYGSKSSWHLNNTGQFTDMSRACRGVN